MSLGNFHLTPMAEADLRPAVALIRCAMNDEEAAWAENTFQFYFQCQRHNIDSAREFYCARDHGRLCGMVGLHHYRWGPPKNVWLSWFAVHPEYQGQGLGGGLIDEIEIRARALGYRRLLVETYSGRTFEKARQFYVKKGFVRVGEINGYLPDQGDMLVYAKALQA